MWNKHYITYLIQCSLKTYSSKNGLLLYGIVKVRLPDFGEFTVMNVLKLLFSGKLTGQRLESEVRHFLLKKVYGSLKILTYIHMRAIHLEFK